LFHSTEKRAFLPGGGHSRMERTALILLVLHIRFLRLETPAQMLQITPKKATIPYIFTSGFPQNRTCFPQFIRMWKTDYARLFPPQVFHKTSVFAHKIMSFSVGNPVETVGNMRIALCIHEYSPHALDTASSGFCGKRQLDGRCGKQKGSQLVSGCFVRNGDVSSGHIF